MTEQEEGVMVREMFELEHGGPNPFYRCKVCGEIEPGLREYLVPHMDHYSEQKTNE